MTATPGRVGRHAAPLRPEPYGVPPGDAAGAVDVMGVAEVLLDNLELLALARGDVLSFTDSYGRRLTVRLATADELLDRVTREGEERERRGEPRGDGMTAERAAILTRRRTR